jgi:threonine dehydrogenase-like Zn-dependent dehydrogenase
MTGQTSQHVQTADRIDHTVAAVWRGGDDIALESIPVPPLEPGEVLVRVRLATVCGSDRHTVSGRRSQPCPSILGHETVGEIVALGAGGVRAVDERQLQLGQRIIWSVTLPCGTCDRCLAGVTAKCRTVRKAGHEALDSGWRLSGGYAQHVLLPRRLPLAIVDDDLPDAIAARITDVGNCDVLLEFSGSSTALQDGLHQLDVQGVAVLAGSVAPDADVALDPEFVVRRHLSIRGVHNYEPRHLTAALSFLQQTRDRFPWSDLVADPVPLDGIGGLLSKPTGTTPRYSIAPR